MLLWWVGKMLHQDVVTRRLSPPTGMYPLTLSSPMPGQHNGGLLYSQCGPFPPFPARSGPNPRGVLPLCFSERGSNCLKLGGLVKHVLGRPSVLGFAAWFMCKAVVFSCENTQRRTELHFQRVAYESLWPHKKKQIPCFTLSRIMPRGPMFTSAHIHLHMQWVFHKDVSQ